MKAALVDGSVIIIEPGDWYKRLQAAGLRWNRRLQRLEGKATADMLEKLSEIFLLPPRMAAELARLQEKQRRIDAEKVNKNPVPLMEVPVKAKLFKHQIRAVNMALIAFEVEVR